MRKSMISNLMSIIMNLCTRSGNFCTFCPRRKKGRARILSSFNFERIRGVATGCGPSSKSQMYAFTYYVERIDGKSLFNI